MHPGFLNEDKNLWLVKVEYEIKEFETLPRGKKRGFCDAVYIGKQTGHARFVRQRLPKEHPTHAGQLVGVSQVGVDIGIKKHWPFRGNLSFCTALRVMLERHGYFFASPPTST
jgi:hypothetical protein